VMLPAESNSVQNARGDGGRAFAGFQPSAWAFALRIWAAMMLGLYAAFWLQLESASSAAVTVGVLAVQTRGRTYQKAIYRILATIIGVIASFVIAGLFPQTRELFMLGFAGWLGLCVYVGGLLEGNRAYGAVLVGYTVANVAVVKIDSPQDIFLAGVNRGAAIVVGIAAIALINDLFAAPNTYTSLIGKIGKAHQRVRDFTLAILRGGSAHPIQLANLLREITALHPDITTLAVESSGGGVKAEVAACAAVALVAEVRAASALASFPVDTVPSLRGALGQALADPSGEESRGALELRLQRHADAGYADPHDALWAVQGLDLLIENQRVRQAVEDLEVGRLPRRRVNAPIYRSHHLALRAGLRTFLAVLICAILLSLGGWPFAALAVAMVGVMAALSANTANPSGFATDAVIAVPFAALLAGVTEYLILDGVDQFPLLAIGMAPSVITTALLITRPKPRLASIAYLVLVFLPVVLSPTNPPDYNPETYLFLSFMVVMAMVLLSVILRTVLPVSDPLRRHWYLASARDEMRRLLAGIKSRYFDDEALFRDADRIGQLAAMRPAAGDEGRDDLRQALDVFGRAAAVRRVRTTLALVSASTCEPFVQDGYSALAASDSSGLRRAAADLASEAPQLDHHGQRLARAASLDLIWAAFLFDAVLLVSIETHGEPRDE
jgi:uncharacterized membrane protein YccC